MPSFGTLGQLLKLPSLSAQKCHSAGGSGGPQIFVVDWNPNIFSCRATLETTLSVGLSVCMSQICFGIGILIFLLLRSTCKISES